MKIVQIPRLFWLCASSVVLSGCGRSNNLLLGRVEAMVGTHKVVVTDCYRTSVPPPQMLNTANPPAYRFKPCRDADVLIRGNLLLVNDQAYGQIDAGDGILVDHGVVSIHRRQLR